MAVAITLAVAALLAAVVCALGWRRTADRLTRLERRVAAVEREVQTEVLPELDRSRRDSEAAFGAGARRALARFTADVAPLGKTRKVVTMASRVSAPRRGKEAK